MMFLLIRFWWGSFSFSEREGEIRAEASGMSGYYYYYDFSPGLVLFFDIDGLGIFVRCDVMLGVRCEMCVYMIMLI